MFLFMLFVQFYSHAQSPAFYCYTKQQGLVCEEIYDVHQDKLGFMWIATDRGVFRYDGYTFDPFTTAQGLTDNTVFRLFEDFRGRIWMMPFNGELCYIEYNRVVHYEFNDTIKKYLPGVRIARSLNILENGTVKVGLLNHGFINIDASGRLTREAPVISDYQRLFWAQSGVPGNFLMSSYIGGADNGRTLMMLDNKILSEQNFPPLSFHMSGLKRKNGSVLFCVDNNVYETNAQGQTAVFQLPYSVLTIIEDSHQSLWVGTSGGGILKYEPNATISSGKREQFYPNEIITSIIEDMEGSFWVATHHSGLLYLPNVGIRSWSFFGNDKACDLLPDADGKMFVLWRDHGLTSIDKDTAVIYDPEPTTNFYNTLVWNEKHNAILIGTSTAAFAFTLTSRTYTKIFASTVNSIACSNGVTYLGQSWNLCSVDANGKKFIYGEKQLRHRPDALLKDHEGTIWVGTLEGLYKVEDTVMRSVSSMHDLFTRRISGMCELPDSTLVVATQSNGIAFLHNEKVQALTQADHFLCDHVYGIVAGNGNTVWCSTQEGLYEIHYSRDSIKFEEQTIMKTIVGFGGKPGFVPELNQLWLCDGNRVIAFDPSTSTSSAFVPPIYITDVMVSDSSFGVTDTLRLKYDENSVRISFCGIAYRMQGHVNYRYRLKGSGDEWQFTKQNTVQLAGLRDGDYTFEVQAQNETGQWSAAPATFSFTIIPPFWSTWWFIAGCVVIGGLWMYILIVLRFRMIRRRDLLREQALIFRQQALASQMNPHFVFNTLNTIQALVLKEDKTKALDMFSVFATLLRKSLHNSTERFIPLHEELKILQLYFELEEMRFEGNLNYQILLGKNVDVESLNVPAMLIQPLVENALVHGIRGKEGGGSVDIRFELENGKLLCEVEDNGIGRAASSQAKKGHSSSGTRITRDRLRVLGQMNNENYLFEIIDKTNPLNGEATGTLVRLTLPFSFNKVTAHEETHSITG